MAVFDRNRSFLSILQAFKGNNWWLTLYISFSPKLQYFSGGAIPKSHYLLNSSSFQAQREKPMLAGLLQEAWARAEPVWKAAFKSGLLIRSPLSTATGGQAKEGRRNERHTLGQFQVFILQFAPIIHSFLIK